MIELKKITILSKEGCSLEADLEAKTEQGKSLLSLKANDLGTYQASGSNFFECFKQIRAELEKKNWFALCMGAAKNVHSSGMALQMSNGLKAYRLELGKQGTLDDLVDIFEPAMIDEIGTIEEQRTYFATWIKSLQSNPQSANDNMPS